MPAVDGDVPRSRPRLTTTGWRWLILTICALAAISTFAALVLQVTGVNGPPWHGASGLSLNAGSRPFTLEVTSVSPGGPAARAGLRTGDLIDLRANSPLERYWLFNSGLSGRPIALVVSRGSLRENIRLVPIPIRVPADYVTGLVEALWLLLFAALIAWRRAAVPQMRFLALALATWVLAGALPGFSTIWAMPATWMYFVSSTVGAPIIISSFIFWAFFASSFAQPLTRSRRIALWLCCALSVLAMVPLFLIALGIATLCVDPVPLAFWFVWPVVPQLLASFSAVVCSVLAIAASRGIERRRAIWSLTPLTFLLFIASSLGATVFSLPGLVDQANTLNEAQIAISIIAPLILTYAAFSRRFIDVGFALNRAAGFAIISAILVTAFVFIEWATGSWLMRLSHASSTTISMAIALGLGLSLSYIHKYVDRFVDRFFFKKRHDDEAALRRFAHEAAYITDPAALVKRTVATVIEHTNAVDAAVLIPNNAGAFETAASTDGSRSVLDENDPAILALRAWRNPVDPHEFPDTSLCGDLAFPMVSRGALVGVLGCGPKRDGESYAPDETQALLALAHGVGSALDALSLKSATETVLVREAVLQVLKELGLHPSELSSREVR